MKTVFSKVSLCLCFAVILAGSRLVCSGAAFTLTPNTVSNTYAGTVTLQVTGLTTGASVVVQKYLDANADGIVDAGDQLVQQFNLTDGQAGMVIGGVTNINVPGDTDSVAGQITAKLNFLNGDIAQNFIGQYLYVVSSASANFAVTNLFTVTNYTYPQKFTGTVFSNGTGTASPYAAIILFPPPRAGHGLGQPLAATLANASGNYSIQLPTGTYSFLAARSNYVYDVSATPVLALTNGATVTANLTLSNATATITGRIVDATNTSIGLPGVFMDVGNSSGLVGLGGTDTNGNFTAGVTSGTWQVEANSGLIVHGYVELDNSPSFSSGSTGVSIAYQKASALFYGTVKDNLGNPLPGVAIEAYDNNNGNRTYDTDGYSGANGNYVAVALGGLGPNDVWDVDVDHAGSLSNYLFSQSPFDQNGNNGTNLPPGYVVPQNFTAILATNQISGYVLSNGVAGISGVGVFAIATIGGISYSANVDTDSSGHYSLTVPNGTWDVSVNCNGGSDSLSSLGLYQCPSDTNINVANANATATFDVQAFTTFISGRVLNDAGGPVTNMNLFAFTNGNGSYYQATTDSGGNYTMGIVGGSYTLQLNNDPNSGFPALGLVGPNVPVTVTNGDDITNFILVAPRVTGAIRVQVNNPSDVGDSGIGAYANLMRGATNYMTLGNEINTDSSGAATLPVFNGTWSVGLDGSEVQNQGYNPPASQNTTILNNTNTVTFNLSGNNNPLQFNMPFLPNGTNGVYYSQSFQASGGQPPYTWALALASANPPANLTLGTNGVISGTPSATPSTYYFDVQVTDSAMNTMEQDGVSITIVNPSQPLTITNVSLPNGNVGVPYSAQLGASGGQPAYTWALALGSANPPPGLTLYSSGLISGTPTTNGLTSFKVQVTDSTSTVVKKVFGIIINPQPVLSLPNWLTNRFQMQLAGGSNQNYTVLVSSNLTTWSTLLVTNNPTTNSFLVTDPHATNQERAYRVLIGP